MFQRKNAWTQEEDKVLKHLRQERGITKWSKIAELMAQQFQIAGRNGKQCRERYNNKLDKKITSQEWTDKQEIVLLSLHTSWGNKWAFISNSLPGRSDNCVKNHFYSKLRKSVRDLNRIIMRMFRRQLAQIRISTVYKIIEISEQRFKSNTKFEEETIQSALDIIIQLYNYGKDKFKFEDQKYKSQKKMIQKIVFFEKGDKKYHCSASTRSESDEAVIIQTNEPIYQINYAQNQIQKPAESHKKQFYQLFKQICFSMKSCN